MKTFLVMILFITLTQAGEQKQKKVEIDSTSVWVNRTLAIKSYENQREQMKQKFILEDAYLAGQIEVLKAITQDSIEVKKELVK